ncbi:MrcB family domain-containing protein [Devosia sp. XGJD_8]|uniref:MrcB family domain-containing protein n=1 Tax=Devosia sp. XGJD_8 TaxID=3391187 RepID=UPI0039855C47
MSLALLTSRDAVQAAMDEFDKLGRQSFLERYGYGESPTLLRAPNGNRYDAEPVLAAAVGKQHPGRGALKPGEFRADPAVVADKLEELGFAVVDAYEPGQAKITAQDIGLIASAREKAGSGARYTDLTEEERNAYGRVHTALEVLGELAARQLGHADDVAVRLTSGFHPKAGVRGYVPKDLWFAVYPAENADTLAGNPQIFMIVSERGLEYGFGAAVHPRDFSTPALQSKVRETAPIVFQNLPQAHGTEAAGIAQAIDRSGGWLFLEKHRLSRSQARWNSLQDWLAFLQSPAGHKNAAGSISRFVEPAELDQADLEVSVTQMADLFRPLILRDWSSPQETSLLQHAVSNDETTAETVVSFAERLQHFFAVFSEKRRGPFGLDEDLRQAMSAVREWLEAARPVLNRPTIEVKMSVGQGSWTRTPWIALLDSRVTTSTQRGIYLVFLIAEDLSATYLTLNQGMTDLVRDLGQRAAVERMQQVGQSTRPRIAGLVEDHFTLNSEIDLRSLTGAARNYEAGTIMNWALETSRLPSDTEVLSQLEVALQAYEEASAVRETTMTVEPPEPADVTLQPFTVDDALEDLFMPREVFEQYLSTWRAKKNLILQGAPGVGKSFVAKRLAYALIGAKDSDRVETVQFHQSYSYEDFVQGYRPNGSGAFELQDGTFYRFRDKALSAPDKPHVLVIDEINRGNLSKIFGELMLLIEADKRGAEWSTRLAYAKPGDGKFYVPDNLFIIGMMNTADRSLSLVDYALRRRFAFMNVDPMFSEPKFAEVLSSRGIPNTLVAAIRTRMAELNEAIGSDTTNLGRGFRIGHSFFTPAQAPEDSLNWYTRVVETEIYPLLEEYWFDNPAQAEQWRERLLAPMP